MIGRIVTMVAGRALAKNIGLGSAAGPTGAMLGAVLPTVARRLGPLGTVAAAFAAYKVAQKMRDQAPGDQVVDVSPSKRRRSAW